MKKKKVKHWLHLKVIGLIKTEINCASIASDVTDETSF